MQIKCIISDYLVIPEYMDFTDKNGDTQTIKLDNVSKNDDGFTSVSAEILGDIADDYYSDIECLADNLQMLGNDFENGLIWEKVIFTDDEGTVTYSVVDGEIIIDTQMNRPQDEKAKDASDINTQEEQQADITSSASGLKEDDEYVYKNEDIIIINGQEYCSFKRLEELSNSLSPEDREILMKSINKNRSVGRKKRKSNDEIER
jgi:hypothetical protein